MKKEEIKKIIEEMERELNGDADHDLDVLARLSLRYSETEGAEELLTELERRMQELEEQKEFDEPMPTVEQLADDVALFYKKACNLIEAGSYDQAAEILEHLTDLVREFPLSNDFVWTDFTSFLEGLVYQDEYRHFIGDREIVRHPLKPGKLLFTYGSLLIEMGRATDAVEPLQMLFELDPVCPKYLFELGEAYKRIGHLNDAYDIALKAAGCAANHADLARAYRDLAYCLSETGAFEDSAMLYKLSLEYQPSGHAENELAWIKEKSGISADNFSLKEIQDRCAALEIPIGLSETVRNNIAFLSAFQKDSSEAEGDA